MVILYVLVFAAKTLYERIRFLEPPKVSDAVSYHTGANTWSPHHFQKSYFFKPRQKV